jgi:oxygen-independent coproporphyrinogen-3 oxidase
LEALPRHEAVSLYVHVPFCSSLCWFCGCHTRVVNSYSPIAGYVDTLLRELELVGRVLGATHRLTHLHFGGGSPTLLSPGDIARLTDNIRDGFIIDADTEFAVEIDPRGVDQEKITALAKAGLTRASLGVQDVNPAVQRAVNRWQPETVTRKAVERLREAGITKLNIDLMYGLPKQTAADVERTVDSIAALTPQRVAVFGYAHVPEMKGHQRLINDADLPGAEERMRQYETAHAALVARGYQAIGLDHFALPDDPLAMALGAGKLARNFQGYTTDVAPALIGVGASAISSLPQGYAQNAAAAPEYRAKISTGAFATVRGRALTEDDRLRRAVIERLMCDLTVDLEAVASNHGASARTFATDVESLAPLKRHGLVHVDGHRVTIPEDKRTAVRLVCAVFDAYLPSGGTRHSLAV